MLYEVSSTQKWAAGYCSILSIFDGKKLAGLYYKVNRCLAKNGLLFTAEKTKSLSGRLSGLMDIIKGHGFEIYSDEEKGDFTFIEARKL